ncbi:MULTISPECIES: hypothetical protein [unclassified Microbulbifer]|uniref:hypothetical protein n=1 Tax=unclassified Microbulbifer TaxID=2619833 RepID=UPI0027E47D68|nr:MULTISPECIES: hypothetical protein [unclassified Microbulbifer]
MANIKKIKDKQNEKLKGKSDKEKALAAARRAMQEMRKHRDIKEPDQLASGRSDKDGNMVIDELTPDEEIDIDESKPKEAKDD